MASSQQQKDDLADRIAAAQAKHAAKTARKTTPGSTAGYETGMKMVLDLVGGAVVGIVFGLAFDQVFHTKPWGFLVWLTLGLAAGFRLMLRTASQSMARSTNENTDADGEPPADIKGQDR